MRIEPDGTPANDNKEPHQGEIDPELLTLLDKLEERQRKEARELASEHERAAHISGNDPATLAHREEIDYMQEERFRDERESYIHDYYRAQELKHQMSEDAARETLEHGPEQDGPKLSQ